MQEQLVEQHMGLVKAIAWKVLREHGASVDIDDLVAHGMEGLVQAAQRFDPQRGVSFVTFAYHRIRGAMGDAIRQTVRPLRLAEREALASTLAGRAPLADEVVERREQCGRLRRAVDALPRRERHFIRRVYFEDAVMGDAGRELGVSKSWASRIHSRAIGRLRAALVAEAA